jgi:hypothetical protein
LKHKIENRTEEEMKRDEEQRDLRIQNSLNEMITLKKKEASSIQASPDELDPVLAEQLARDDGSGMTIMWRLTTVALLQVNIENYISFFALSLSLSFYIYV